MKQAFSLLLFGLAICLLTACMQDTDGPSLQVSTIYINGDGSDVYVSSVTVESDTSSEESSETSSETSSEVVSEAPVSSQVSSQDETSSESAPTYDGDWKLLLVNSKNLMPEGYVVKTANIGARAMDERIVDIVKEMMKDAQKDGVELLICSSYRSVERQTTLYNEQIQNFLNQGYSQKDAEVEAGKWVAIPGTSEHHTGLALDIVTPSYQMLDDGFANTDAFAWLYEHCTEYGFVLRYPKDKSSLTGIVYEPWHYRYVGKEAAAYMREHNLCLEEYVAQQNAS